MDGSLIISIVTALVTLLFGGSLYIVAGRFAGKPSALYYAEQEVKRLQLQCSEFEKAAREYVAKISLLERQTNIDKALEPLRVLMAQHEANANARSEAILAILNVIAGLLGDERAATESVKR